MEGGLFADSCLKVLASCCVGCVGLYKVLWVWKHMLQVVLFLWL